MRQTAVIVIPTKQRPGYLQVTLASIAPQANAAKVDLLVVDDAGPSAQTREIANRFAARYEPHPRPLGLNVARNTGIEHSQAELVIFIDDDVEAQPGWLPSLLDAAAAHPQTMLFAGRIHARLEGRPPRSCGRELPPITTLDLGPTDLETEAFAWGANMAARRSAFALAGPFDPTLSGGGDEQEWQERLRAAGAPPTLYVAGAKLIHRRTPADSRLRSLSRAAYARGAQSRSFDAMHRTPPSLRHEAATLLGCIGHVIRYRCLNAVTMAAHSAGRISQALRQRAQAHTAPPAPPDDFLSGESGEIGELDGMRRELADRAENAIEVLSCRQRRLARAAQDMPRRHVLALGITRERHRQLAQATIAELSRSSHEVQIATTDPGERGKFENLNALLAEHPVAGHDWLILFDDDIELPRGFLDRFLFLAERFALDLAQPAHRRASHAAWRVTRRQPRCVARETRFVEIGPLTALASSTFSTLLPFPPLRMGWGLDAHWAAIAQQQGWRCGVIDALAINHRAAPVADSYSRQQTIAEARAFLAQRPYLPAHEAQRTLAVHRRW